MRCHRYFPVLASLWCALLLVVFPGASARVQAFATPAKSLWTSPDGQWLYVCRTGENEQPFRKKPNSEFGRSRTPISADAER
jgi:invasion protein IalB